MFGAIISISFSLFAYVYILVRASFLYQSQNLIDLGKNLGFSKFKSFYKIILPAARPAIVAGLSLVAMETLACLLYTSPSPRDATLSRMPSSA